MTGTPASARVRLVRAPNPSPMTLDGTNGWVLTEPGGNLAVVVDPGPDEPAHADAIEAAVNASGADGVGLVVLTHGHPDHAAGAGAFAARVGTPVRAADPSLCVGGGPLTDGERLVVAGLELDVVATPGHTADSVCLLLGAEHALLTGDTVLGAGSTVVARPDGELAAYLASLRRLRRLADERGVRQLLPGHGPVRDDPQGLLDAYLAHREQRLDQVRAAIAAGARDVDAVLSDVYRDVEPGLREAARWSTLAQLDYLRELGEF
jgi:glyoxylase-like metal-dependent hydrolase (beta-lactamase superfamily II)